MKTIPEKLFYVGYEGSRNYRIPSLLTTMNGTILAAADKMLQHGSDYGDIDLILRRKEADETEFSEGRVILSLPGNHEGGNRSAFVIDPCMLQDKETGRIFLLVDMFPESSGCFGALESGAAFKTLDGVSYPLLVNDEGAVFTIQNGRVIAEDGADSGYRLADKVEAPFRECGDLYKGDTYCGCIYLSSGPDKGDLHVPCSMFLWLIYSDDDGITWSAPTDITPMVKKEWMMFLGTGPGVGIQLINGDLVFPVYHANKNFAESQSTALIISSDHGETWELSESPITRMGFDPVVKDQGGLLTESQIIQIANGDLKLFMRNNFSDKLYIATSKDNGKTFISCKEDPHIPEHYCQLSVINYKKEDKEYVLLLNPSESGRLQGKLYLGIIEKDGEITWQRECLLAEGHFQYSCITRNSKGNFEILYELDDEHGEIALYHTEIKEELIDKPFQIY